MRKIDSKTRAENFSKSTFSVLLWAIVLLWCKVGIEVLFLFMYFIAFQNSFGFLDLTCKSNSSWPGGSLIFYKVSAMQGLHELANSMQPRKRKEQIITKNC